MLSSYETAVAGYILALGGTDAAALTSARAALLTEMTEEGRKLYALMAVQNCKLRGLDGVLAVDDAQLKTVADEYEALGLTALCARDVYEAALEIDVGLAKRAGDEGADLINAILELYPKLSGVPCAAIRKEIAAVCLKALLMLGKLNVQRGVSQGLLGYATEDSDGKDFSFPLN